MDLQMQNKLSGSRRAQLHGCMRLHPTAEAQGPCRQSKWPVEWRSTWGPRRDDWECGPAGDTLRNSEGIMGL
jgi:hypothetical protein